MTHSIPENGLLRLEQIIGHRGKGIPPVIPVCASSWWNGVRTGKYPQPIKLGPRTTAWRAADIRRIAEHGPDRAG